MRLLYWIAATLPLASAVPVAPQDKTLTRGSNVHPRQLGNVLTLAKGDDPISKLLRNYSGGSLSSRDMASKHEPRGAAGPLDSITNTLAGLTGKGSVSGLLNSGSK
ncbi:hypothetical protein McanMca71_001417 [Microsporum canis]|uniref:Uncharacterized protein n=1 Tax=Arthroderma otae (strain ATCC MYA-4605 / CBS 113480) TaxID=554155 RepID=C5FU46_ARTOC|nr:uncharacterized protein MCYG_06249 [Microsporum canis CBS 113480]EEQ33430.1 predicted protein [Microsporum canis CBS 113480]